MTSRQKAAGKTKLGKPDYPIFWIGKTKEDNDGNDVFQGVKLDYHAFIEFIYKAGFRYTKIHDNNVFYRIKNDRILEQIEISDMSQFVMRFIDKLPEEIIFNNVSGEPFGTMGRKKLWDLIVGGINIYFNSTKLQATLQPRQPIVMNEDGPKEKFMYFKNGFLHITPDKIVFKKYKELKGYIWETEIIDLEYTQPLPIDKWSVLDDFFFYVSGAEGSNQQRYKDLRVIAGYLMHSYSNYKLKAILLTDSTLSEANEPNGRSGKTLFMRLVGGALCKNPLAPGQKTFVEIGAKNFDPADKHKYDKCNHETKLIVLNDVKRGFKTEWIFNDITDGLEVNKKNQQPFIILSKIAVLSNLTIELPGESNKDRFCIFEFSDFFNSRNTPQDVFKHWFFRDWSHEQFVSYYYYMASCVQDFLKAYKLPEAESINYAKRQLYEHTNRDFISYIENDWSPVPGEWYETKSKFNEFIRIFPDYEKLKQQHFTNWIKKYMALQGKYEAYKETENFRRESDGTRMIKFTLKKENTQ